MKVTFENGRKMTEAGISYHGCYPFKGFIRVANHSIGIVQPKFFDVLLRCLIQYALEDAAKLRMAEIGYPLQRDHTLGQIVRCVHFSGNAINPIELLTTLIH